eukprot:1160699-Pelagomonas_calceolata.AAC.2
MKCGAVHAQQPSMLAGSTIFALSCHHLSVCTHLCYAFSKHAASKPSLLGMHGKCRFVGRAKHVAGRLCGATRIHTA